MSDINTTSESGASKPPDSAFRGDNAWAPPIEFSDKEQRQAEMSAYISASLERFSNIGSDHEPPGTRSLFTEWLETQAQFHTRSWRNTLLIHGQFPTATKIRDYDSWAEESVQVNAESSAIWQWDPIYAKACPQCGESLSYHKDDLVDCAYHVDSHPEYWSVDVVGTRPAPYFDVSQTSVLLGTAAEAGSLLSSITPIGVANVITESATRKGYEVRTVSPSSADFGGEGAVRRDVLSFSPVIWIAEGDSDEEAYRLLKYYTIADEQARDGELDATDRMIAHSVAAGVASQLNIPYPAEDIEMELLGDTAADVEGSLSAINNRMENMMTRFQHIGAQLREQM